MTTSIKSLSLMETQQSDEVPNSNNKNQAFNKVTRECTKKHSRLKTHKSKGSIDSDTINVMTLSLIHI